MQIIPEVLSETEAAQLAQTIEMFEVITQSQPLDYQSLDILKEAYSKLGRDEDVIRTSKRIAEAYVQLGQLSSAILEYESILQRFPEDPDVLTALAEIENRATNLVSGPPAESPATAPSAAQEERAPAAQEIDDGREAMFKLFVGGKHITEGDFNICWITPALHVSPEKVYEPFLVMLNDRQIMPLDKSFPALTAQVRMPFIPIERYEVDIDVARSVPREICQRWCILPFDRMSQSLLVATANPFNKQAVRELEGKTKHRVIWYLASPAELTKTVRKIIR